MHIHTNLHIYTHTQLLNFSHYLHGVTGPNIFFPCETTQCLKICGLSSNSHNKNYEQVDNL